MAHFPPWNTKVILNFICSNTHTHNEDLEISLECYHLPHSLALVSSILTWQMHIWGYIARTQMLDNSLVLNLVICRRTLSLSLALLNLGILVYVQASITSCSYCLNSCTISKWCGKYWEMPLRRNTSLVSGSNIKVWLWEKITDLYASH